MKKLTKKEKILVGASIIGIGVAGYFGYKYIKNNNPTKKKCLLCDKDKGPQCINTVNFENYNASVRFDLDSNSIDTELVKIDNQTGITTGEWSDGFPIYYCPVCGEKLPEVE